MSRRLEGQVVIVTGATKGIGRETARQTAREGALVTCTGRTAPEGASLIEEIAAEGGRAIFEPHDIAREADWRRVISRTEAELGPIRGVVNNAGAFFVKPLAETSEADFDSIYDINVRGSAFGVKLGLDAISRSGKGGAIVMV